MAKLEADKQVDFVHTVAGVGRFRANAYRQQRGLDLVLRAIPPQPPTLATLGLPAELGKLTHHHQGLVLITGPSGCGKTSTLAALVNLINQERQVHILTAEEPIEYIQPSRRALVNQREIGSHSESYARMLRGALREDPDVIALGDLRDHESISLALTAAETGHLVIATMHTGGAIRTINRLIGAFPPNEQDQVRIMVSESLRAIVSQRLVPRQGRPRPRAGGRGADRHPGGEQPDPRAQELPDRDRAPARTGRRDVHARAVARSAGERGRRHSGGRHPPPPRELHRRRPLRSGQCG